MDLMAGHNELMEKQKPVNEILANNETKPRLRALLVSSQKIRDFASKSLHLPNNDSYRSYADLKRPFAVWNVVAANEFAVEAKKWCFLVVGCLSYRGYFSKDDALAYANELKKEGYDVYVAGANAYSTLGWFDDPLLNTMMYKSEARRAGIIFHELAHQQVYIDNDSGFNEAFATTVEQEGVRRWLISRGKQESYQQYLDDKKRDMELNLLLKQTRQRLKAVYQRKLDDEEKRAAKKIVFKQMQEKYQHLKKSWGGYNAYDKWMKQELNNAHLLLIATYHDLVPMFQTMLSKEKHDLKNFYTAVEQLGSLDKLQRTKKLNSIATILQRQNK
ncbi:MAG: aminopeptidase [Gammaproteobacteria bacterium]|nr:aminopeptidase [Gammaproteobacteria bacterium]